MARNYRSKFNSGYSKAKSYGGRAYGGYNRGRKAANQGVKLRMGNEWLAGAVIGATNMDEKIPSELKLAGATMPVGGKLGGKAKAVFQGIIFGNIVQHYLGLRVPGKASGTGDGI